MTVTTILMEYLNGGWEYVLIEKFSEVFKRKANKLVGYKKVVMSIEEAKLRGVVLSQFCGLALAANVGANTPDRSNNKE